MRFAVMLLLCLTGHSVSAQNYFGVKAGANLSFINYKTTADNAAYTFTWNGSRPGFQAGGVAQVGIGKRMAIQPELLLVMKGADNVETDGLGAGKVTFKLMTIDLPVSFIYRNKGFFGGLGPNFQYGISSRAIQDGYGERDMFDKNEAAFFYQKRFEAGINLVAGYQMQSGFTCSINYAKGLTNSSGYDKEMDQGSQRMNAAYLALSVGYLFRQ